jgi:hypothetical protein
VAASRWSRAQYFLLGLLVFTLAVEGLMGIGWGLPTQARVERVVPRNRAHVLIQMAKQVDVDLKEKAAISNAVPLGGQTADLETGCLRDRPVDLLRAMRRFLSYPCDWDEPHIVRCLAGMKPSAGDFNPRMVSYGGLAIYPIGALIKVAILSGYLPQPSVESYLNQPEVFARIYRIGRCWMLFLTLLSVLAVAWAGTQMYSPDVGLMAAILHAISTPVQAFLSLMKPHIPLTAFAALVYGYTARAVRTGNQCDLLRAAVACGLAAALAPTAASAALVVGIGAVLLHRSIFATLRTWILTGLVAAGVYLLFNPYCLLDFNSFRQEAAWQMKLFGGTWEFVTPARFLTMQLANAFPWPLLVLIVIGTFAPSRTTVWPFALLVVGVCASVICQITGRPEPALIRYVAVCFPLFAIWAAVGLEFLGRYFPLVSVILTVWAGGWVLCIDAFYAADRLEGSGSSASQERAAQGLVGLIPAGARVGLVFEAMPRQLPAMDLERWCLEWIPEPAQGPSGRLPDRFITGTFIPPAAGYQVVGRWIPSGKLIHLKPFMTEYGGAMFLDYLQHTISLGELNLAFPLHLHQVPIYLHRR